ncbi:GIY-YIG nuclease family protein [Rhodohalobacter barkolensis]|uniref:Endonuclease n=1 Tax=Rhodohalobacter barkolensis TaxID=2053187 RepID=A0A2N0VF65_9BACT|nr:GIY-YIG nuclease family protein [Rhodohalobacter barkolensis]PKD42841.1 endonuclease [Rhodohalobacter barkolensis]
MFTVYILQSEKYDKIYIGYTSNLRQRFKAHNKLATKGWTVKYRPWKIIHTELYKTKEDALKRENMLKGGQGRKWIRENLLKR